MPFIIGRFGKFYQGLFRGFLRVFRRLMIPLLLVGIHSVDRLPGVSLNRAVGTCLTDSVNVPHRVLSDRCGPLFSHKASKPAHGLGVELIDSALADAQDFADFFKGEPFKVV